jgi:alanine-glyoxylate transaminase/serine-glyoxylate transaminase/serine-pyruvate transaminase
LNSFVPPNRILMGPGPSSVNPRVLEKLVQELEKIGLKSFIKDDERLPQLTSVSIPDGIDEAKVRMSLLNDYNIEIGAGLGELAGKVWRIGLMGYSSSDENINSCVSALKNILGI